MYPTLSRGTKRGALASNAHAFVRTSTPAPHCRLHIEKGRHAIEEMFCRRALTAYL